MRSIAKENVIVMNRIDLIKKIYDLTNPYPSEMFKSDIGVAANCGWEACRKDVIKLINDNTVFQEVKA